MLSELRRSPLPWTLRGSGGQYDTRSRIRFVSRGPSATDLRERIESVYDLVTGKKSAEKTQAYAELVHAGLE